MDIDRGLERIAFTACQPLESSCLAAVERKHRQRECLGIQRLIRLDQHVVRILREIDGLPAADRTRDVVRILSVDELAVVLKRGKILNVSIEIPKPNQFSI